MTDHITAFIRRRLWVFVALSLLLSVASAIGVRTDFGGRAHMSAVSSGSMAPSLPTGTVTFSEKVKASEVQKGDIIIYDAPAGAPQGSIIHRVTGTLRGDDTLARWQPRTGDEGYMAPARPDITIIQTKGDANPGPDPWHLELANDAPVYRVTSSLPLLGYLTLAGVRGMVAMLALFLGAVLLFLRLTRPETVAAVTPRS